MNIYTSLHIGAFHTNYCEDFLITENLNDTQKLIAVFDGCSMGKESVFASILFGKLFRNIAKKEFYKDFVTVSTSKLHLKTILRQFFTEINAIKRQLDLNTYELLSTIIVGIVNTDENSAEILVVGDGLVCVDGEKFEFEQGDKPDYISYHLSENFEDWFANQQQKVRISKFKDLSIATDGIFAFKNLKNPKAQKHDDEIINALLCDREYEEFDNFLDRQMNDLHTAFHHVPTDDIAIIRMKA